MDTQDKSQDPTEEATPKRKEEARKQGNIARSPELNSALILLTLTFFLPPIFRYGGPVYINAVQKALSHLPTRIDILYVQQFLFLLLPSILLICLPLFLIMLFVGIISNITQVGFIVNIQKLAPSFSKLNPLNGLKKLFSREALFELIKSLFKLLIFGYIGYNEYIYNWQSLAQLHQMPITTSFTYIGSVILSIITKIAFAWLILAILDYVNQYQKVRKQIMMTKQELKQEMKEQEASPEIRSARSKQRQKLLKARIADNVARADAIITNPTHFSVAIKYERDKMFAPMVVAKGQDYLALKIREIAKKNNVLLVQNVPLARALHKECEIGDMIPKDYYKVVAEILAFVYQRSKHQKR